MFEWICYFCEEKNIAIHEGKTDLCLECGRSNTLNRRNNG